MNLLAAACVCSVISHCLKQTDLQCSEMQAVEPICNTSETTHTDIHYLLRHDIKLTSLV